MIVQIRKKEWDATGSVTEGGVKGGGATTMPFLEGSCGFGDPDGCRGSVALNTCGSVADNIFRG